MPNVLLGIGSNIRPQNNIASGLEALSECFSELHLSPVYESRAVGFDGDNFLNLVVAGHTRLSLVDLAAVLRDIEFAHGREANAMKYSSRHLDIDILTYDELVGEFNDIVLPREEVLTQAFVLQPLADLVPDFVHPIVGKTYQHLWQEFSGDKKNIWPSDVYLTWPRLEAAVS